MAPCLAHTAKRARLMDPQAPCCHNPDCPARGQVGQGNIRIHSRKERRYRCLTCRKTFAGTAGTVCFRLHTAVEVVTVVLTLRCYGGPLQAMVAAFDLDERTNTAYIERINATFRSALTPLVRRDRAIAHQQATLYAGMWLVGTVYNFCWEHERLRLAAPGEGGRQWQQRTPAVAAGLTDHRWSMRELRSYQIPLPTWVAPQRRGRPPRSAQSAVKALAA
ncbi:MAG: hypothetical protein HY689_06255 [Chloroflexi bacterium]|nr:hypothetical protein [Chloroflexota bacterium]